MWSGLPALPSREPSRPSRPLFSSVLCCPGKTPSGFSGKFHLTREVIDPDGVTFPLKPGPLKVIQSRRTQQP